MRPLVNYLALAAAMTLVCPTFVRAFVTELPASLERNTLSETVPTAFAPFDLATEDYEVEWEGGAPSGARAGLLSGTVQWVRVADVLTLPRARLRVEVDGAAEGRVLNAGFSQAFAKAADGGRLVAEIPVALTEGAHNEIDVAFSRGGQETRARARLRFRPRRELGEQRVFYDASCSRFGVHVTGSAQQASARGWALIGCRLAKVEGSEGRTSDLEVLVYWDGVGQSVRIGGVETPATSDSVWPLRLRSQPGEIRLAALDAGGGDDLVIHYAAAEHFHLGGLSLGLGPYWENFSGNGETTQTPAALLTLYGSYFITESLRAVAFDASTLDRHMTMDLGIYLSTESVKFLDRRFTLNLLLGAHAIGFSTLAQYYFNFGAPQGAEITFTDFLRKGCNLSAGLFLYPLIDGKSYYNAWLRWGSGRFFAEFNYISWDELAAGQSIHSDSTGVSVGMPLFRFL